MQKPSLGPCREGKTSPNLPTSKRAPGPSHSPPSTTESGRCKGDKHCDFQAQVSKGDRPQGEASTVLGGPWCSQGQKTLLAAGARGEATARDKGGFLVRGVGPSVQGREGPTQLPAWPEKRNQCSESTEQVQAAATTKGLHWQGL